MPASCWERFCWELRPSYPLFSVDEPTTKTEMSTTTTDGENEGAAPHQPNDEEPLQIDVAAAFAPPRAWFFRIIFTVWSFHVLYTDLSAYPPHNLYIYMGYLTHWGHMLSNFYFICSLLCSICMIVRPSVLQQPEKGTATPGRLVRITWGLYSCVAPLGIAITMLYWSAVSTDHPTYVSVMEHGGIAVMVLIDGLLVGVVPVRAKQIFFLMIVCATYLAWSIVDAVLEIGNGEWGPAYEDDALYPVLNWNNDRKGATIVSAFVICVLAPCLFYGCWLLSLRKWPGTPRMVIDSDSMIIPQNWCCGNFDGSRRALYHMDDDDDIEVTNKAAFDYTTMPNAETHPTIV